MIDTFNKKYEAREATTYELLPEADFILRVKEIGAWTGKVIKGLKVIKKDEKGRNLKDEQGKNITEDPADYTVYTSNVKLEVVGGEHDGRLLFHTLTTHPNQDYNIPAFLFGVGLTGVQASEIPRLCLDKLTIGSVIQEEYIKKETDSETGLVTDVAKTVNKIKTFKQLANTKPSDTTTSDEDLGI